jgi:hypothetical protein
MVKYAAACMVHGQQVRDTTAVGRVVENIELFYGKHGFRNVRLLALVNKLFILGMLESPQFLYAP